MVEVGIPVYKAKAFLTNALDSLVAQTFKRFIVCLSIDGDGEDYSEIINEYRRRGLKIRTINSKINGGPGMARQRILDTTQCDYIMFLDADDMYTPRAVEVLYTYARLKNYDILRSSFIRENGNDVDRIMAADENIITWFHGKIYKTSYIRKYNLCFLPELRTDEDAYFNMVAWNTTKNLGMINEVTYIWRNNKSSITRIDSTRDYYVRTYMNYIGGQVKALHKIFEINEEVLPLLITNSLLNLYYYYMRARFYKCDETPMNNALCTLRNERIIQEWLNEGQNWLAIAAQIKGAFIVENEFIVFYEEPFNKWAERLLRSVN